MKESFIIKAPPESFKGVSPKRKGGIFWLKFMPDSVGTTPQPGPCRQGLRIGFYWPTARADAQDLVQRCVGCQLFANQSHIPPTALKTIPITWPFAVWGLDMVGPLKRGTHKQKYLLVMVDKFTKWIEASRIRTGDRLHIRGRTPLRRPP